MVGKKVKKGNEKRVWPAEEESQGSLSPLKRARSKNQQTAYLHDSDMN